MTLEKAFSACVDFEDADYELITLGGAWAKERQISRRPLAQGDQGTSTVRGASSHQSSPFLALAEPGTDERRGQVYAMALCYSGSFQGIVQVDQFGGSRMMMGIQPFDFAWTLAPGESFQTPEAYLAWSDEGLNGMSQAFHQLVREHIVRGTWAKSPRPILINNWEATYFDFNEEKLVSIAKCAKERGIDLFVLDDGWFGRRDMDNSSLGDWTDDLRKLPEGLRGLSEKIHGMGLKFGLWVEPEMVSPDSDLYRAHPDWCLHVLFESCAGGGGRFDLGLMRMMPQAWTSDDTDAWMRCRIQYGPYLVFPPCCMGAHVSAVSNHQTGRSTPLKTRAAVAMGGTYGYELDLRKLSEEELDEVAALNARVRAWQDVLLYGSFYRLRSPFAGDDCAWISVAKDGARAAVTYVLSRNQPSRRPGLLKLAGLDPAKNYRDEGSGRIYGGDELMQRGIPLPDAWNDYDSCQFWLERL